MPSGLPRAGDPTRVSSGEDLSRRGDRRQQIAQDRVLLDDLVPWSNNEYLADLLPNSEIHPLDAGHFAWEQASDEYGRLVVDWVTGGFRRLGE